MSCNFFFFLNYYRDPYFHWRLDELLFLDLLAEDGVKQERSGTVVDQPGWLLEGLQICPLLTHAQVLGGLTVEVGWL